MIKGYKVLSVMALFLLFTACAAKVPPKVKGVERTLVEPTYLQKLNGETSGQVVFLTEYGQIKKGATMSKVMDVLGFPHNISSNGQNEIWYYNHAVGKTLSVNFSRNEVVEVKELTSIVAE